jgi:hypothetical protein
VPRMRIFHVALIRMVDRHREGGAI